MVYDAGAFPDASWEWFAAGLISGPYRWPGIDVRSAGVRTNRFGSGHYRAPSGPQGLFALESLLDELAATLGIDPIELAAAQPRRGGRPDDRRGPMAPDRSRRVPRDGPSPPAVVGARRAPGRRGRRRGGRRVAQFDAAGGGDLPARARRHAHGRHGRRRPRRQPDDPRRHRRGGRSASRSRPCASWSRPPTARRPRPPRARARSPMRSGRPSARPPRMPETGCLRSPPRTWRSTRTTWSSSMG